MIPVEGDEETEALMERLELLLRARHAEGRCCHTDCLHCPYRTRDGWSPDRPDAPTRP